MQYPPACLLLDPPAPETPGALSGVRHSDEGGDDEEKHINLMSPSRNRMAIRRWPIGRPSLVTQKGWNRLNLKTTCPTEANRQCLLSVIEVK